MQKGVVHHRIDGPAIIERDPQTGQTIEEIWKYNGYNLRIGELPSIVTYRGDGSINTIYLHDKYAQERRYMHFGCPTTAEPSREHVIGHLKIETGRFLQHYHFKMNRRTGETLVSFYDFSLGNHCYYYDFFDLEEILDLKQERLFLPNGRPDCVIGIEGKTNIPKVPRKRL